MSSYLIFPDIASANARSHQQAVAKGCDATDETQFWWGRITDRGSTNAALVIEDSGDYGPAGIAAAERAQLQTEAQLTANGWVWPSGA